MAKQKNVRSGPDLAKQRPVGPRFDFAKLKSQNSFIQKLKKTNPKLLPFY